MDLFKIIPENFFSILASKNKHIYLKAIMQAFKIYEEGSILGIDKKIVVEVLTDFCEQNQFDEAILENSSKEKANFLLRKLEECGWIDIDVTNDYEEILNFRDYAIQIIEALQNIIPSYDIMDNVFEIDGQRKIEFRGYIYTIYSLLNSNTLEYGLLMEQVYRNTKLFIRELRKLDARLKEYIKSIVETTEIKDLIETLINYKTELVDKSYQRLKTSDNVNKYRLFIINKLENMQDDEIIMDVIARDYMIKIKDYEQAYMKANRDINEIIDIFNELDDMILEIDAKNRTYVNSTIGKIKFLLAEDNNIVGKLNAILKFIKTANADNKLDEALKIIKPLYTVNSIKTINEGSLYQPRGSYNHMQAQELFIDNLDFSSLEADFFKQYESPYKESEIIKKIDNLEQNVILGSELINYDSSDEEVLTALYMLIYANDENKLHVIPLDDLIEHKKFKMKNFKIERNG